MGDTDLSLFRVYYDPAEIAGSGVQAFDRRLYYPEKYQGYPFAWFEQTEAAVQNGLPNDGPILNDPIKDIVREQAGHRCVRCGHPFVVGKTPGRWSPCDEFCKHAGPLAGIEPRLLDTQIPYIIVVDQERTAAEALASARAADLRVPEWDGGLMVVANWRVLTVHHLNGIKHDCRWWNLVALCQRCHLVIQAKVHMQRPWHREHSEWFKPYVAGFYASVYAELDLTRGETEARLETLLSLEHRQLALEER